MSASVRVARAALVAAGVVSLFAAAPATAQRHPPRVGVAASPPPENPQTRIGYPYGQPDPRWPADPRWRTNDWSANRRGPREQHGSTIVYVPVPIGGYGYSYDGYYAPRAAGQVYDANGRPLSASYEPAPAPASIGYGYTPDLTGSPYAISDEGMMVVDFPTGARRAFPSCAAQSDLRDPQGRPRTIFYQPSDYWMVLKPGQRGRVRGEPAADAKACYAIDSAGRVVLRE